MELGSINLHCNITISTFYKCPMDLKSHLIISITLLFLAKSLCLWPKLLQSCSKLLLKLHVAAFSNFVYQKFFDQKMIGVDGAYLLATSALSSVFLNMKVTREWNCFIWVALSLICYFIRRTTALKVCFSSRQHDCLADLRVKISVKNKTVRLLQS